MYGEEIVETGYDEDWEDEVGEDELVGDEVDDLLRAISGDEDDDDIGYDELVGARRRRRKRRPKKRPISKHIVRKVSPGVFRRYPLGLGVTALAAGATAVITVTPQLPYKLMRLSSPSLQVTVDNIQIGTVSQFVAAGGVPAECMAPNAIGAQLKGDTCVPGVQIQVTVTDVSAAPNTFRACLWGLVAQ